MGLPFGNYYPMQCGIKSNQDMYKYKCVKISGKKYDEHRLVAIRKFGAEAIKGMIVHHINGDKRDNRPENLELMTREEHGRLHSKTTPRPDNAAISTTLKRHYANRISPYSRQVIRFNLDGVPVERFESCRTTGFFGFKAKHVSECCNGVRKTHHGSLWAFLDDIHSVVLKAAYSRLPLRSRISTGV